MAPIPSFVDEETRNLIDGLKRRQKDLSDFQIPRLRDCKDSLAEQERLSAELKEDLEIVGKQTETLSVRTNDYSKRADRETMLQLVQEFREATSKIRSDMRSALLHSKKIIDTQAKTDREKLFAGSRIDTRDVEEKATDDALMKASNDVTDSLRRTIGLMQNELERSVLSHQILEQSTSTLRSTGTQHDMLTAATHTSKQLITALEKADWLDRLLVLAALTFFILVVLFIMKQRLLDRGLKIAFWWTRFLPAPRDAKTTLQVSSASLSSTFVESAKSTSQMLSSSLSSGTEAAASASSEAAGEASTVLESISSMLSASISVASSHASSHAPSPEGVAETLAEKARETILQHAEL